MTPRGIFTLCLLITLSVGIYVISGDVGGAINSRSRTKSNAARQKLQQQQAEWKLDNEVDVATLGERIALKEAVIVTFQFVTPIALVILIGITLKLYHGWTDVELKRANFQATLIKLDPVTRTYPIVAFEAGGRLRLHDPNNKTTIAVDMDRDAIPMLVQASTAIQLQSLSASNQEVNLKVLEHIN